MHIKWTLLLVLVSLVGRNANSIVDRNAIDGDDGLDPSSAENEISNISSEFEREKRAIKKFGVLRHIGTIGGLAYEQYRDTLKMLQQIYDLFEDTFLDTYTTTTQAPGATTPTLAPNVTTRTTTPRYRVSRQELGRIASRNWRGLQKLGRLEWAFALNDTRQNIRDYQRDYKKAVFAPKNYSSLFG